MIIISSFSQELPRVCSLLQVKRTCPRQDSVSSKIQSNSYIFKRTSQSCLPRAPGKQCVVFQVNSVLCSVQAQLCPSCLSCSGSLGPAQIRSPVRGAATLRLTSPGIRPSPRGLMAPTDTPWRVNGGPAAGTAATR